MPFSGNKVSSSAERHLEVGQGRVRLRGIGPFKLFFSFRLIIDALMEDVPMALHMYKWGLLRDQDGAAAIAAHLGLFFFFFWSR